MRDAFTSLGGATHHIPHILYDFSFAYHGTGPSGGATSGDHHPNIGIIKQSGWQFVMEGGYDWPGMYEGHAASAFETRTRRAEPARYHTTVSPTGYYTIPGDSSTYYGPLYNDPLTLSYYETDYEWYLYPGGQFDLKTDSVVTRYELLSTPIEGEIVE